VGCSGARRRDVVASKLAVYDARRDVVQRHELLRRCRRDRNDHHDDERWLDVVISDVWYIGQPHRRFVHEHDLLLGGGVHGHDSCVDRRRLDLVGANVRNDSEPDWYLVRQ
jgi:hypothetical protein